MVPWAAESHTGSKEEDDIKELRTEHVYFSDSNDFVWKRVNTITVTTELRGFEGLTLHCFPRERVETAEDQGRGLKTQVALFVFTFFSEMHLCSYHLCP